MILENSIYFPHDLLWLKPTVCLPTFDFDDWVMKVWNINEPVIVRRDHRLDYIPVGIRGKERNQRQALWIQKNDIIKCISPQKIIFCINTEKNKQKFADFPVFCALQSILYQSWPFEIGVTGSLAISLVSDRTYVKPSSDLDLTVRCDFPVSKSQFNDFYMFIKQFPTQIDVQIETPQGGFLLNEWMKCQTVLLKTNFGPVITDDPWRNIF